MSLVYLRYITSQKLDVFRSSGVSGAKDPTQLGLLEGAGYDHWALKEVLSSMYVLLPSYVICAGAKSIGNC
jgi:hypothetical protein